MQLKISIKTTDEHGETNRVSIVAPSDGTINSYFEQFCLLLEVNGWHPDTVKEWITLRAEEINNESKTTH